jgi:hypothetical protein
MRLTKFNPNFWSELPRYRVALRRWKPINAGWQTLGRLAGLYLIQTQLLVDRHQTITVKVLSISVLTNFAILSFEQEKISEETRRVSSIAHENSPDVVG